jgi:putative ABC transport system permease protein
MFRLSLRSLLAKKLRLVTTAIAIVLGVAFTTGTMILADTMTASISTALDEVSSGVGVVVRGEPVGEDEVFTLRAPVPLDELDQIRSTPGIAAAAPYWEGYTQILDTDGKALDLLQSVGLNWIDDTELSMFELDSGRPPDRPGEVVLGLDGADEAGVTTGDRVELITSAGRETFVVTGLARLDGVPGVANSAFTFFTDADAEQRLGDPGTAEWFLARGDGSVSDTELASTLAASLPGLDVVTGAQRAAEQKDDLGDAIGIFETILLVFGGIALFVGSFTIANTFTITVAQRTKELALVRAIGASRGQVLGSVVIEAAMIGTIAAIAGLASGLGVAKALTWLLAQVGLEFPGGSLVVQSSTIVAAFVAGIVVTVGAAIVPARRAARVAPVAAMRDASIEPDSTSRKRVVGGSLLAAAGAAALVQGISQASPGKVGLGSIALFHATLVLGPVIVRPLARVLSMPLRHMGASGRLAAANALRNPKRTAATASALTVGVMLVAGASMFASTASASIRGDADDVITADRVIRPAGSNPGLPMDLGAALAELPGTSSLPIQSLAVRVDGEMEPIGGIDLVDADGLLSIDVLDGQITADSEDVVIGDELAEDRSWSVGDRIEIGFVDGVSEQFRVSAVIEQTNALPALVTSYETAAEHGIGLDQVVLFDGDADAIATAESITDGVPTALLGTVDDYATALAGPLDTVLSLVLGLLGLAVVIAVLGIATTIGLSIHERTRELGVLRAVGLSRRQLRRSIRLEAILIALFGTTLGLAMGLGFTSAVISTLADDGFRSATVPSSTLVAIVIGALLAGTAAAALPARSAARRNVLDAISTS